MNIEDLQMFIDGIKLFFDKVSDDTADIGKPFVKGDESIILDYTGLIDISGGKEGWIYFTGTSSILIDLAKLITGMDKITANLLEDMAGEISNTITGNAQEESINGFEISVPKIIIDKDIDLKLIQSVNPIYVVPINWKNHKAFVVIGLN
jgi:chemotaxis protein CheX